MGRCNNCGAGTRGPKGEPGIQGAQGVQGPSGGLFTVAYYTAYAGGGQLNATALGSTDNIVNVVATTNDSVKLLPALQNESMKVRNTSANTLHVYPQPGEQINSLGVNVPFPITAGGVFTFACAVDGTYIT